MNSYPPPTIAVSLFGSDLPSSSSSSNHLHHQHDAYDSTRQAPLLSPASSVISSTSTSTHLPDSPADWSAHMFSEAAATGGSGRAGSAGTSGGGRGLPAHTVSLFASNAPASKGIALTSLQAQQQQQQKQQQRGMLTSSVDVSDRFAIRPPTLPLSGGTGGSRSFSAPRTTHTMGIAGAAALASSSSSSSMTSGGGAQLSRPPLFSHASHAGNVGGSSVPFSSSSTDSASGIHYQQQQQQRRNSFSDASPSSSHLQALSSSSSPYFASTMLTTPISNPSSSTSTSSASAANLGGLSNRRSSITSVGSNTDSVSAAASVHQLMHYHNQQQQQLSHPSFSRVRVGVRCRPPFAEEGSYLAVVPVPAGIPLQAESEAALNALHGGSSGGFGGNGGGADAAASPSHSRAVHVEIGAGKRREFPFDVVFGPSATNDDVYNSIGGPIVEGVLKGVNGTILAYGQTGSGKTHSLGILSRVSGESGLIPRALSHIFGAIAAASSPPAVAAASSVSGGSGEGGEGEGGAPTFPPPPTTTTYSVTMSFCQLYLENVQDLLSPGGPGAAFSAPGLNLATAGAGASSFSTAAATAMGDDGDAAGNISLNGSFMSNVTGGIGGENGSGNHNLYSGGISSRSGAPSSSSSSSSSVTGVPPSSSSSSSGAAGASSRGDRYTSNSAIHTSNRELPHGGIGLQVREDPSRGFYVEGLSEYAVRSWPEAVALLNWGLENRVLGATRMNATSSRSHTLLTIRVESRTMVSPASWGGGAAPPSSDGSSTPAGGGGGGQQQQQFYTKRTAQLLLCDLAGSERVRRTSSRGARLQEARSINASLHTLGQVIASLSSSSTAAAAAAAAAAAGGYTSSSASVATNLPPTHIPWRDSKLTRLLHGGLGGTSNTYLLATVSPVPANISESLSTLLFASRCMRIAAAPLPAPGLVMGGRGGGGGGGSSSGGGTGALGDVSAYADMTAKLMERLSALETRHSFEMVSLSQRYEAALREANLQLEASEADRAAALSQAATALSSAEHHLQSESMHRRARRLARDLADNADSADAASGMLDDDALSAISDASSATGAAASEGRGGGGHSSSALNDDSFRGEDYDSAAAAAAAASTMGGGEDGRSGSSADSRRSLALGRKSPMLASPFKDASAFNAFLDTPIAPSHPSLMPLSATLSLALSRASGGRHSSSSGGGSSSAPLPSPLLLFLSGYYRAATSLFDASLASLLSAMYRAGGHAASWKRAIERAAREEEAASQARIALQEHDPLFKAMLLKKMAAMRMGAMSGLQAEKEEEGEGGGGETSNTASSTAAATAESLSIEATSRGLHLAGILKTALPLSAIPAPEAFGPHMGHAYRSAAAALATVHMTHASNVGFTLSGGGGGGGAHQHQQPCLQHPFHPLLMPLPLLLLLLPLYRVGSALTRKMGPLRHHRHLLKSRF